MSESYIGHVRFGAGPGCPCGTGERFQTVAKMHHGHWTISDRILEHPDARYLRMSLVDDMWSRTRDILSSSTPVLHDVDQRGDRIIDRWTGLSTGTWPRTDQERPFGRTWSHDAETWYRPDGMGGDEVGRIEFSHLYTFALLSADLDELLRHRDLAIAYSPPGCLTLAGFSEVDTLYVGDPLAGSAYGNHAPWHHLDWLDGQPPTGQPKVRSIRQEWDWFRDQVGRYGFAGSRTPSAGSWLSSRFQWGFRLERERVQSYRVRGYFATVDWTGPGVAGHADNVPGTTRYWHASGGRFDAVSPRIEESDVTPSVLGRDAIYRHTQFLWGQRATGGAETQEWPMRPGGSASAC